jgi:hypothetical protein
LAFGGQVLTTTDITVRAGFPDLGDPAKVAHIGNEIVVKAQDIIKHLLEVCPSNDLLSFARYLTMIFREL